MVNGISSLPGRPQLGQLSTARSTTLPHSGHLYHAGVGAGLGAGAGVTTGSGLGAGVGADVVNGISSSPGRPQFGQLSTARSTTLPHSGHLYHAGVGAGLGAGAGVTTGSGLGAGVGADVVNGISSSPGRPQFGQQPTTPLITSPHSGHLNSDAVGFGSGAGVGFGSGFGSGAGVGTTGAGVGSGSGAGADRGTR